jgi:hypothetical protein
MTLRIEACTDPMWVMLAREYGGSECQGRQEGHSQIECLGVESRKILMFHNENNGTK